LLLLELGGGGSSQEETICATPVLTNSMQVESESCEQAPEFCLQNTVSSPDEFDEGVGSFPPPSSDEQEKVKRQAANNAAVNL
jgi:hypothetical protein